jgi:hypothetical protein
VDPVAAWTALTTREDAVKYLILIHSNPAARAVWNEMSERQRAEGLDYYTALREDLEASGELIVSEALRDPADGKHISVRDGQTFASDGPFAEVKEFLAGFFLVDCESMDRAVEIAGRVPEASMGLVEVRPVMDLNAFERGS